MNSPILECVNLSKKYHDITANIDVITDINLSINSGDCIAITGPSGSGKSTLMHLLGGLDNPSSGNVKVEGQAWQSMTEKKRCQLRNQSLGFIYQFHHLLPEFSALENVALPLLLNRVSKRLAQAQAQTMLDNVGLGRRALHKPAQLSGGERQRVAIARALIHRPKCVLADEPTGNLDNVTANQVFELMLDLNNRFNTALIIVTHDATLAARMSKTLIIQNGRLLLQCQN